MVLEQPCNGLGSRGSGGEVGAVAGDLDRVAGALEPRDVRVVDEHQVPVRLVLVVCGHLAVVGVLDPRDELLRDTYLSISYILIH